MQAIRTKYLAATNFRGCRIKAVCERGTITISYPVELISYPFALSGDACHVAAADALVAKFVKEDAERYGSKRNPWSAPRVCGRLADGSCVHVFLPVHAEPVIRAIQEVQCA